MLDGGSFLAPQPRIWFPPAPHVWWWCREDPAPLWRRDVGGDGERNGPWMGKEALATEERGGKVPRLGMELEGF